MRSRGRREGHPGSFAHRDLLRTPGGGGRDRDRGLAGADPSVDDGAKRRSHRASPPSHRRSGGRSDLRGPLRPGRRPVVAGGRRGGHVALVRQRRQPRRHRAGPAFGVGACARGVGTGLLRRPGPRRPGQGAGGTPALSLVAELRTNRLALVRSWATPRAGVPALRGTDEDVRPTSRQARDGQYERPPRARPAPEEGAGASGGAATSFRLRADATPRQGRRWHGRIGIEPRSAPGKMPGPRRDRPTSHIPQPTSAMVSPLIRLSPTAPWPSLTIDHSLLTPLPG